MKWMAKQLLWPTSSNNSVGKGPPPLGADAYERCVPVYEEMPGWSESTVGSKTYDELPANAKAYLKRIEELTKTPVDIISTGPDREETIIVRDPFAI